MEYIRFCDRTWELFRHILQRAERKWLYRLLGLDQAIANHLYSSDFSEDVETNMLEFSDKSSRQSF